MPAGVRIPLTCVVVLASACGDGGATSRDDAGSVVDAAPEPSCAFPMPGLGTGEPARGLAADPARCGQPAHRWLDDARLGDVVSRRRANRIGAELLRGALETQGYAPPRPLIHDVAVDQLVYVTQDRGELIEATAAVAYPASGFEDAGPRDVVLVLHGTAGFSDACAPSNDLVGQALPALFASLGYLAVAPDYIGLKGAGEPTGFVHPYLVGQATAIASLDSVRALGKLEPGDRGGTCVAPRVLVFGGSQGGHAALWVDRLADSYAPELVLLGVAASVPPADLLGQVERGLTTIVPATGNTVAMLGAASPWYGAGDRLDEVFLAPYDTDVPAALEASCTEDEPPLPELDSLSDFVQPAILDAVADGTFGSVDPWGCIVGENGLTTTSIERTRRDSASYGILVTLAAEDELVHTSIEREAYRQLCEDGLPIAMVECEGADHVAGSFWAMPEILDFLDARAAGEPFTPGPCEPPAPVTCRGTP